MSSIKLENLSVEVEEKEILNELGIKDNELISLEQHNII